MIDDLISQIQVQNIHSIDDLFDIFWACIFNENSEHISQDLDEFKNKINQLLSKEYISKDAYNVLSGFIEIAHEYILQNGEPYAIEEDPYRHLKEG